MRNEAISVLLVLLPLWSAVQAEKDIFDGMTERHHEDSADETLLEDEQDGPDTCIHDIIPKDPIDLKPNTGPLKKIESLLHEMPEAPRLPNFSNVLQQVANAFQLPRFSEMGQALQLIIRQYREPLQVYGRQWAGLFKKRSQDTMKSINGVIREQNKKIKEFFSNHFVQYKEVCLPDTNQCLQSIQKHLDEYSMKVNENVAACKRFVDRQLEQHVQWVENERNQLEKPLLKMDACFKGGRNGTNIAVCMGNLLSNTIKMCSEGMKKFSGIIEQASDSFANRMEKFRTCVVDRKELLKQGQQRIAERGVKCLKDQSGNQHPEDLFTR
ncbi:uncharacterized protein LOC128744761 [Sabethes cyaneus]|uniref:uncharacterized protein LOC128744761 n=1 Tax=Sabethes cyaneus TaxID=53552 RepID=UPI00237D3B8B|nr:uncharacterized protein LOC128744761 [Sabethes cyaneus]